MNTLDHNGLATLPAADYDLDCKISVGTAQNNMVMGTTNVGEALAFMRSEAAARCLAKARDWSQRIAEHIKDILYSAHRTGELKVADDDECFTGCRSKMGFQDRKDLITQLTTIYRKHELGKLESWAEGAATLTKAREEMDKLAWRTAKALYLPAWMFAGTFSQRTIHDLLASSGLMPLDFDHVNNVEALIKKLKNDPAFFAAAKSPSLTGVKALIRIPDTAAGQPEVYLRCFQAIEGYLQKNYPEVTLGVDKQAKAVSQLMFFLHDPEAWCRLNSYIVLPLEETSAALKAKAKCKTPKSPEEKKADASASKSTPTSEEKTNSASEPSEARHYPFDDYDMAKQWETVRSATDALIEHLDDVPSGPGERNGFWTRVGYAYHSWFERVSDPTVVDEARTYLLELAAAHYGGGTQPVQNALDNGNGSCGLGTLFAYAKDYAGWVAPWVNPCPKDTAVFVDEAGQTNIVLPSGELSISKSAEGIFKLMSPTHTIFNKGGHVVELCCDKHGNPFLAPIKADEFRTRVEQHGQLMAWRSNKEGKPVLRPAKLAVDDAKAMLVSLEIKHLPPLSLVTRCAVLTEDQDGRLLTLNNGYHSALGGILVIQAKPVMEVPLESAKEILLDMVSEFDFVSLSDKSRSLAARITPALRMGGFIKGSIPMECMEADEPQSGKGYSHAITTAIYNDQPHFITQRDGGVGSLDESLAQALISGHPFVSFDNIRGNISSPYLESFLTCNGLFFARIPGQKEMPVDRDKIIVLLTSNGMEATPDLMARSSICRIRKPKNENGEIKVYEGIPGIIKECQAGILGAVHSVIREWHRQGKPVLESPEHDFHEWAGVLGWMVEKLLGCAPLMEGHREIQSRASDRDLSWLRRLCLKLEDQKQLDHPMSSRELTEFCDVYDVPIPGVRPGTDTETMLKILGTRMAKLMGETNERVLERHKIVRSLIGDVSVGDYPKSRWFYTFCIPR